MDNKGNEHTLRFVQGPSFITPSLNNTFREGESELISQTITKIEGRIWELDFLINHAMKKPLFFRSIIVRIIESVRIKVIKDLRRNDCTASERYVLFLEDFPGLVKKVPLKHVASYLNMTPETISRIRNELSQ